MSEIRTTEEKNTVEERFIARAETAAAIVSSISRFEEAVIYAVDLCAGKPLCRYEIDDSGVNLDGVRKTIAAPGLDQDGYGLLAQRCGEQDIDCIDRGMRDHLAGVDVGLTYGDIGLAETGTVVIFCPDEELRLATMVCEYHVCVVPRSALVADAYAAEAQLTGAMLYSRTYTAFITGPSRTADIERVLSIGVHGPLELHILILED